MAIHAITDCEAGVPLAMRGPGGPRLVPSGAPLGHYRYYARLMRRVVEDPERYLHGARQRNYWNDST